MAQQEDEVTAKAKEAFKLMRLAAERGDTPELSLEEINAEIKAVREERRKRNGICSH